VHAIATRGEPDILVELSRTVGKFAQASGRHIHLVLENDDNSASLLAPDEDPPSGRYRAQWNDDYHHAWHVLLTGEGRSYYRDYGHTRHFVRSLSQGFAYQGEPRATAADARAASQAGICRRPPSSISCRITIRSVIGRLASG
jgi:maltooligosyltrehalose trehalohydrolase